MREVSVAIDIHGKPGFVWDIIPDFDQYPEWNPFIRQMKGELKIGANLEALVQPAGGKTMTARIAIQELIPGEKLNWTSGVPGIFATEHVMRVESLNENKARFFQCERFKGLLVPLFWWKVKKTIQLSFEQMGAAVAQRIQATAKSNAKLPW